MIDGLYGVGYDPAILNSSAYDVVILIGIDWIPRRGDDLSGIGVIEANYLEGYGTLGGPNAPVSAAIVYHAPAVNAKASSVWDGVSDFDLEARIVAQEAGSGRLEQTAVASVIENRIDEGGWGEDRREVLLRPNQFAFRLTSSPAESQRAVERWADPLDSAADHQMYENALSVVVGAANDWLRDPVRGAIGFRANPNGPGNVYYSRSESGIMPSYPPPMAPLGPIR